MNKHTLPSACILAMSALTSGAWAQAPMTPRLQFADDSKLAQTRYEADKKLCNDEVSSAARLQCRRDAKDEYDKALAAARARMPVAGASGAAHLACPDCGHVMAVSVTEKAGEGSALGIIAGGVGGALLGNQVGSGTGKDLATIAGALGGAYAGKKIEQKVKTHKIWSVSVHYANGRKNNFEFDHDPGFAVGDVVKNAGKSIVRE